MSIQIEEKGILCISNNGLREVLQTGLYGIDDLRRVYAVEDRGKTSRGWNKYFVPWSTIEDRINRLKEQHDRIASNLEYLSYLISKKL